MYRKNFVFIGIVFLILFGFIFISGSKKIPTLSKNNLDSVLKKNEYSIIYLGKRTDDTDELLNKFIEIKPLKAYYTTLNYLDLNELYGLYLTENDKFIIFSLNSYVTSFEEGLSLKKYDGLIRKALFNTIPEDEINYIVPSNVDDYIKLLKSNNYTISVFGEEDCYYCKLFLPTINNIAGKYNLDIYYLDSETYDSDSYNKVMDLDLTIPAYCTTKKIETSFKKGFAKPTTIVTKNGKVVGCIKGNVNENTVIEKFKELNLVEG